LGEQLTWGERLAGRHPKHPNASRRKRFIGVGPELTADDGFNTVSAKFVRCLNARAATFRGRRILVWVPGIGRLINDEKTGAAAKPGIE
jgi:hypothetical protein